MDFKFPPFHENYHMPQITFIDILVDINIFFKSRPTVWNQRNSYEIVKKYLVFFFQI